MAFNGQLTLPGNPLWYGYAMTKCIAGWYQDNGDGIRFMQPFGWIFSGSVYNIGDTLPLTPTVLNGEGDPDDGFFRRATIRIGDTTEPVSVDRLESQPFYTFAWTEENEYFHYSHVPGTYVWYPETGETRLIAYQGSVNESAWIYFTDDFHFMVQDMGTSPGVRVRNSAVAGCKTIFDLQNT